MSLSPSFVMVPTKDDRHGHSGAAWPIAVAHTWTSNSTFPLVEEMLIAGKWELIWSFETTEVEIDLLGEGGTYLSALRSKMIDEQKTMYLWSDLTMSECP